MSENKSPNNVIQFPGAKRKEAEEVKPATTSAPAPQAAVAEKPARKPKKAKSVTVGAVIAVILGTAAVNRFAFQSTNQMDMASNSGITRGIASVGKLELQRDASWERDMAEQLAAVKPRTVASVGIGHPATQEEKLRWGTLGEKYTIVYRPEAHKIDSILLQDKASNPSYILDRNKFLKDYGTLLEEDFTSAKLKSVEKSNDKTVEAYTIFGKDKQPKGEARFELDVHKRLLSLKVEPTEI